jgi:AN1-type zinc finger and ubiquitin domain-containing protein 1
LAWVSLMASMSELNEQMIELTIEALTGTVYDLCVSPFETILGIKMKIQRLEGIPVYQQQLVHGNTELHDELCLEEYSIGSGAQLKLLVAMRGGPIHAHRGLSRSTRIHSCL